MAHLLTQNTRGLPEVSTDAGQIQDGYSYDANGNVTAISDQLPGNISLRRGPTVDES